VESGVSSTKTRSQIKVPKAPRTIDTSTPVMVPNTDVRRTNSLDPNTSHLVSHPTFSPDGQLLAYYVSHQNSSDGSFSTEIKKVPVSGGTPTAVMPSASNSLLGFDWWAARSLQAEEVLEVEATNPANEDTEVKKETNPTIEFNLNLDPATVNGESVKLEVYNSRQQRWVPVTSTPSYDDASKTVSVNPEETLGTQRQYRVTLSTAIKSSAGKTLTSPYSWSFTTKK
jgi:uncharacterized protein YfaS (alpha-2-macroglobulin family)